MYFHKLLCSFLVLTLSVLFTSCGSTDPKFMPTGRAASVPTNINEPFSRYVAESRENIANVVEHRFQTGESPYLGDYSIEQVAEMRGPFQLPESDEDICSDKNMGGGKGFLLIHGLTDSPYLMRSIGESLHRAYPCAVVRAVLLPGHGTVAGDSLTMSHEEWMAITDYGVQSFQQMKEITDLYLVGFSTGTSLAIKYMHDGNTTEKIKGLVLLSAALKANTRFAGLAGVVQHVKKWSALYEERDAARYESFSMHAGAEFYELTKELMNGEYDINIPVFMAVSGDDATIDAEAAQEFFCENVHNDRRRLLWYESRYPEKNIEPLCGDIIEIEIGSHEKEYQGEQYRFANYSHVALPVSPNDPHYGVKGLYRNCKSYDSEPDAFARCQQGSAKSIFGEKDIGVDDAQEELQYDYWRRGTFNPDYERLERSIVCFVDENCDLEGGLQ